MGLTLLRLCPWEAKLWQTSCRPWLQHNHSLTRYLISLTFANKQSPLLYKDTELLAYVSTFLVQFLLINNRLSFNLFCLSGHSRQKSGGGSQVSLPFWQQGFKSSHRGTLLLALLTLASLTNVWTHPHPTCQVHTPQAPQLQCRVVGELLTVQDLELRSHKTPVTQVAG